MPKVNTRTRSEQLRYVAGLATRKYDQAREAWEAFSGEVDTVRTAVEATETYDLSSLAEQVRSLQEAIQELSDAGAHIDNLDELTQAADQVESAMNNLGLDTDALGAFTDAYEELEQALDTYEEYREPGSGYDRDDKEGAWDEVTGKMEELADAADQLGFDMTFTTPEPGVPAGEVLTLDEVTDEQDPVA
jgi:tetratricopeptide (TPR) repeat protein